MRIYIILASGITRPFLLFATEEVFIGQLFDAYIFRMKKNKICIVICLFFEGISQVATISMRDNPEDEVFVSGIK